MSEPKNICICGGGNLGHVLAAVLSHQGNRVSLLTGHPERWSHELTVTDNRGKTITGHIYCASGHPEEVIPSADIILLCLPGYMIGQTLASIKPHLAAHAGIGSVVCSNGFFWMARHILGAKARLFGFQRVPYICRMEEYGKSARIKGYKTQLKIAGSGDIDLPSLSAFFSEALDTPVVTLKHYLEATLTNSNPLLHPSRIYGMFARNPQESYDRAYLFYEEWDDFSSEVLIRCDHEFQALLKELPVNRQEIPDILTYYESTDAASLTRKIRSIEAFKGIRMSMAARDGRYYVDYANRYFTEDIPFGLLIVKSVAAVLKKGTPSIDTVIRWMQEKMGKEYLTGEELKGKDIYQTGIIQCFGLHSMEQFIHL